MSDITWIADGTLKGNPSESGGCETQCGTKQKWSIGIVNEIGKVRNLSRRSEVEATPYTNQIVLKMIPEDTSGGFCTSSWKKSANPSSHKMEVGFSQRKGNVRVMRDSTIQLSGGDMGEIYIPITDYGSYIFTFKTLEWGEDCNKPTGTDRYSIIIKEKPQKDKEHLSKTNR